MFDNEQALEAYFDGLCAGVERYAWWRDGTQYVGTSGKTLREALTELASERIQARLSYMEEK